MSTHRELKESMKRAAKAAGFAEYAKAMSVKKAAEVKAREWEVEVAKASSIMWANIATEAAAEAKAEKQIQMSIKKQSS